MAKLTAKLTEAEKAYWHEWCDKCRARQARQAKYRRQVLDRLLTRYKFGDKHMQLVTSLLDRELSNAKDNRNRTQRQIEMNRSRVEELHKEIEQIDTHSAELEVQRETLDTRIDELVNAKKWVEAWSSNLATNQKG